MPRTTSPTPASQKATTDSSALVKRALELMGGEQAFAALRTISMAGNEMVWEHEYSYSAMPDAEVRESSKADFVLHRDFQTGATRIDWDRDIVRLKFRPYPTLYKHSEVLSGGSAYVQGIDSSTPTALAKLMDPPGSPMSSIRMIVTQRELARQSPKLVFDMYRDPGAVATLPHVEVDGRLLPALDFKVKVPDVQTEMDDWNFIVLFDPDSGLPERIRTRDGDPIQGATDYDLVLTDWRDVDGIKIAHHLAHRHSGRALIETKYSKITINPDLDARMFDMPISARAATVRSNVTEAYTNIPYQWTIRRVKWGGDINTDAVAWDSTETSEPYWITVLPGIDWTGGVTHNSIMIEMDDYLIIWEASLHENFAEWMIRSAKRRHPGKPIKYLVLSHHHLDHNGGARPFVAEGVSIITPTGPGYESYFNRMFEPNNPLNDRLHRNPRKAEIIRVNDTYALYDTQRKFMLYNMKGSEHAPGLLIAYVSDVALLINTDLWNTNEKLGDKPLSRQQELLNAVKRWKIEPVHSASGHGPIVPFSNLSKLAQDHSRASK